MNYVYSLSLDFPDGKINEGKLVVEISASAIVTALNGVSVTGDVVTVAFKASLSAGDRTILDGNQSHPASGLIAVHDNTPSVNPAQLIGGTLDVGGNIKPFSADVDGYLKTANHYPSGDKIYLHSVNWCDKCTWYPESIMVHEETLVDSGDGKTFTSQHDDWIDMSHGRVTDEDYQIGLAGPIDTAGHEKWIPIVTVDGAEQVESYLDEMDEDYQIDYENGMVTFNQSQSGKTIKVTYWYAVDGMWKIVPNPGKKLELTHVELQFSRDIILRDTMCFQAYGYAGVFAPQIVDGVNVLATTRIPIGKATYYKRAFDFINEANGTYPIIPPWGGSGSAGWRGFTTEILTFPWNYMTRTDLYSSYGMEVWITMMRNVNHVGELGTISVYAVSKNEIL